MTDAMIEELIPLVNVAVTKFRCPPGLNRDDLFSVGQVALVETAARWDESVGVPFKNYAYQGIKNAIRSLIHRHRSMKPLQPEVDGTVMPPPADTRSAEPGAIVAARETLSIGRLMERLPSPETVSTRALQLRDAMFDAIEAEDVRAIVKKMTAKAKEGDIKAARFVTDLVASGTKQPTHQKVIVFAGNPKEVTD